MCVCVYVCVCVCVVTRGGCKWFCGPRGPQLRCCLALTSSDRSKGRNPFRCGACACASRRFSPGFGRLRSV
ncbi:hypothetical protein LZ30DRAFT_708790 [Colletotrichum cereale]|nr:hypothetical protein LZ30DRAFT_708790 [Colletotrichum cereale]